jgi:hypothetical protein
MKLDVDKTEWERPFNRLPARPQSSAKRFSNGAKRFCIDLRALNKALQDQGWQIPNIKELIERIGALKMKPAARYFQRTITQEVLPGLA